MHQTVWLNGEFVPLADAKISILDRGFLFADSVYEVIPAFSGVCFLLEPHLDRLEQSLTAIGMVMPMTKAELSSYILTLIEKNGGGDLAVYCQITRGVGPKRNHVHGDESYQPTLMAMTQPIQRPRYQHSYAATLVPDIRWSRADIKSTSLLPNTMLKQQAYQLGAEEALLYREGCVQEGAATNVFIVKDGQVYTPPKSQYILGGITRDIVLDYLRALAIEAIETEVSLETLYQSDEVWITSSTKGIMPIGIIKTEGEPDKLINNGQLGTVWARLNAYYWSQIPV